MIVELSCVQASDREEEIPDKVTIPNTPRLIIAGENIFLSWH